MQASVRNGERCDTAKAYLRPIMDRPNLHISINTLVTKVNKYISIDTLVTKVINTPVLIHWLLR